MADVVTKDNPSPVKLKFEKVYSPCILQVSSLISINNIQLLDQSFYVI